MKGNYQIIYRCYESLCYHCQKDFKNSFYTVQGKMMVDLADAVDKLESWSTGKGLIIYGHEHNFCSGGDLNWARKISNPENGFRMAVFMQKVLNQLGNLPLISVALIEGIGRSLCSTTVV